MWEDLHSSPALLPGGRHLWEEGALHRRRILVEEEAAQRLRSTLQSEAHLVGWAHHDGCEHPAQEKIVLVTCGWLND